MAAGIHHTTDCLPAFRLHTPVLATTKSILLDVGEENVSLRMSPRKGIRRVVPVLAALFTVAGLSTAVPLATASPAQAAIISGRCAYTSSEPTLSYDPSTYKTAVKQLQCELNWSLLYTPYLSVDGYFGSDTRAAVRTFQKCAGITVDGIVGPQTWSKLNYWAGSNNWLYC